MFIFMNERELFHNVIKNTIDDNKTDINVEL